MIIATPWAHTHTYRAEIWRFFLKNSSSFLYRAQNKQRYFCSPFLSAELWSWFIFILRLTNCSAICKVFLRRSAISLSSFPSLATHHTHTQEKLLNRKRFVLSFKTRYYLALLLLMLLLEVIHARLSKKFGKRKKDFVLLFFSWPLNLRLWNSEVYVYVCACNNCMCIYTVFIHIAEWRTASKFTPYFQAW